MDFTAAEKQILRDALLLRIRELNDAVLQYYYLTQKQCPEIQEQVQMAEDLLSKLGGADQATFGSGGPGGLHG